MPNKKNVSIEPQLISHRFPLRFLPRRVIDYIAAQAWTERRLPGDDLYDDDLNTESVYLVEGCIVLHIGPDISQTITPDSPMAEFPLACPRPTGATRAICQGNVKLIRLPSELVESVSAFFNEQTSGNQGQIELKEDDPGDQIYLDFLNLLNEGDYVLPALPDIAMRITQAVENRDSGVNDIVRIIQTDMSLATRMILTANSPAFGGESRVSSCQEAVVRLGFDHTRSIVVSYAMKNLFQSGSPLLQERMKRLWHHSRRVAAICHVLARMTPSLDPERAMLAALMHDIGYIPLLARISDFPELLEDPDKLDSLLMAHNSDIGALLIRSWGFDQDFIDAALHSDQWFRDTADEPDYADLVIVAQLLSFVGSNEIRKLPPPDLSPAYHKLIEGRLSPALSLSILNEAEKEIRAVEELLEGN